jgi:hypothetical protein
MAWGLGTGVALSFCLIIIVMIKMGISQNLYLYFGTAFHKFSAKDRPYLKENAF